jgi:hypothetical protein
MKNSEILIMLQSTTRIISLSGSLEFGDVSVGTSSTATLTIANSGASDLTVSAISLPTDFTADWTHGNIAAGESQDVTVTFTPTSVVAFSGTISVTSNATSGTSTIAVSGTGLAPIISLSGSLAFGYVITGNSSTATLTITNIGNSVLTVSDISLPTGFTADWISGTIAASGSQDVTVTFTPTSAASYSGNITVTSDALSGTNTIAVSGTGTVYDHDAETYFSALTTAGASLTTAIESAFSTFVVTLKSASIWSKISVLYPFIGGTATTHAINAKNPGTYDITWNGTLTHSANGVQGDGSTGYGLLDIKTSSAASGSSASVSIYSRTSSSLAAVIEIGSYDSGLAFQLAAGTSAANQCTCLGGIYTTSYAYASTNYGTAGCFISNRNSLTSLTLYRNGTSIATNTATSSGNLPGINMAICARRYSTSTINGFSSRQISFAHVGSGLTSDQVTTLNSAIVTLQTALSRNV